MTLYLILHKVRGEPAFDIAQRLEAPDGSNGADPGAKEPWWIIPTSGHRAYPCWHKSLDELMWGLDAVELAYNGFAWQTFADVNPMPPDLRDHYAFSEPSSQVRQPRSKVTSDDLLI